MNEYEKTRKYSSHKHREALSHPRNVEQYEQYFPTHNVNKPSRLQMLRNTISQRTIEQSSKKFTIKSLLEVRIDKTDINIMKNIICESWFSPLEEEILQN